MHSMILVGNFTDSQKEVLERGISEEVLPIEIIELIQQYVDGESIYIPRKPSHRKAWGTGTQIRQELLSRDRQIYEEHLAGSRTEELVRKYYLSEKSIQRILRKMKKQ